MAWTILLLASLATAALNATEQAALDCMSFDNRGRDCTPLGWIKTAACTSVRESGGSGAVQCRNISGTLTVTRLQLSNKSMTGTLPTELGYFTNLNSIDIQSLQYVSGTFPSEMGALRELRNIALNTYGQPSAITGTLPSEIGGWTALRQLYFGNFAHISGTLPGSAISRWTNVVSVNFAGNDLISGTVPTEFGGLSQLQQLLITFSPLISGSIPRELGYLSDLGFFALLGTSTKSILTPAVGVCNLTRVASCFITDENVMCPLPTTCNGMPVNMSHCLSSTH